MKEKLSELASITLAGLMVAAVVALVVWVSGEAREARENVQQNGLQSVVNDVWCGKAGCKTACGKDETP